MKLRRARCVAVLVGFIALLSLALASPAQAQYAGLSGRIMFASPSGNWTVSTTGGDIHELNSFVSGCGNRNLAYSPDGKTVAYTYTTADNHTVLWKRDAEFSGKPTQITTNTTGNDCDPVFSPDGSKLAFARQVSGTQTEVFVVGVDGSGLMQLTTNIDALGGSSGMPVWKDANMLYIVSTGRIVTVAANLPNQTNSNTAVVMPTAGHTIQSVDVDPAGKNLVFCESDGANQSIRSSDVAGANNRAIVASGAAGITGACYPVYSPDGSKLLFVGTKTSLGTKDPGIYTAGSDGTAISPLSFNSSEFVALAASTMQPAWGVSQVIFGGQAQAASTPAAPGVPATGTVAKPARSTLPVGIAIGAIVVLLGLIAYWLRLESKKE